LRGRNGKAIVNRRVLGFSKDEEAILATSNSAHVVASRARDCIYGGKRGSALHICTFLEPDA
jgi:hypothetical protein